VLNQAISQTELVLEQHKQELITKSYFKAERENPVA
jgi:hypothetical protein